MRGSVGRKRLSRVLLIFLNIILIIILVYDIKMMTFWYSKNSGTENRFPNVFSKILETGSIKTKTADTVAVRNILCRGRGLRATRLERQEGYVVDPYTLGPFKFLPNYKNPCFLESVRDKEKNMTTKRVRCIPYFYIVGMPKCGTTDLWHALSYHPDVYIPHFKEPMWFNRRRFGLWNFQGYLNYFNSATEKIRQTVSPATCYKHVPYRHIITGEGSVDYSFDNSRWTEFPGNEDCNEPIELTPHHIRHLYPGAKLIFMLRNPVDRTYSDYLFESTFIGYQKSKNHFHINVLEGMINHLNCRKLFSHRACAYNHTIETYKARLRVGMYHVFIEDWLRVFPKEQILFIKFEDYTRNMTAELSRVLKFLDLRPMTVEEQALVMNRRIQNVRSEHDVKMGDMFKQTRDILQYFYEPFNKKLSKLLNDDRYLWKS